MFPDIGTSELIILAVVILLVVKPQDLPMMMRKIGEFMGKARRLASEFRSSFEDMARQSELDDLRREVEALRSKAADPTGLTETLKSTGDEIQSGLVDPDFDYGAQTEHIPWEDPIVTDETASPEAAAPKLAPAESVRPPRKKAPAKKTVAKKSPTKAISSKAATPKSATAARPGTARAKKQTG